MGMQDTVESSVRNATISFYPGANTNKLYGLSSEVKQLRVNLLLLVAVVSAVIVSVILSRLITVEWVHVLLSVAVFVASFAVVNKLDKRLSNKREDAEEENRVKVVPKLVSFMKSEGWIVDVYNAEMLLAGSRFVPISHINGHSYIVRATGVWKDHYKFHISIEDEENSSVREPDGDSDDAVNALAEWKQYEGVNINNVTPEEAFLAGYNSVDRLI